MICALNSKTNKTDNVELEIEVLFRQLITADSNRHVYIQTCTE